MYITKGQQIMKNLYSIKDEKIGFGDVFVQPNDAAAVRNFSEAVNQKDTPFNKYPNDFVLFKVGSMSEDNGEIKAEKKELIKAKDCVIEQQ